MTPIFFIVIVIVLICLGVWAVQNIPNMQPTPKQLLIVLVIVIGMLFIASKLGMV